MCFLTRLHGRRLLSLALWTGLALEGSQLLLMAIMGIYFRSVDINDTILNASGVLVGGGFYRTAVWMMDKAGKLLPGWRALQE